MAQYIVQLDLPMKDAFLLGSVAVAVAVRVGVLLGLYPVWKASKMSPVEAGRYE
ncbi:MAG: hypothetical protein U9N01_04065 [Euryarchaeota archaeon]|nr:hypothetical protein [Euryarchaeota archaeon]